MRISLLILNIAFAASADAKPYLTQCAMSHLFKKNGASITVKTYTLQGKFVLDDDHYEWMVVPYTDLEELNVQFLFRHILSGPIQAPTDITPGHAVIYAKPVTAGSLLGAVDIKDLELGEDLSGNIPIPETATTLGPVNSVTFECRTNKQRTRWEW